MKYFLAVAGTLSFRKAAEQLRIAQPALSSQIKDLEEHLGVRLFERTTRSVRLTGPGRLFMEEAHALMDGVDRAEQNVRRAQQGILGSLRIGIIAPSATPRLAKILNAFRLKHPRVQFVLSQLTSIEQTQRLREEQIDLAFMRPPQNSPDLESHFVEESPQILAAPAGHRLTKLKKISWPDFHGEQLVLIHPSLQNGFYDSFMELCSRSGSVPVVGQYANDIHAKMWLISAGFGVAPTSGSLVDVKRPGLVFRDMPAGLPVVQTALVWRRNSTSPVLKNFIECFGHGAS